MAKTQIVCKDGKDRRPEICEYHKMEIEQTFERISALTNFRFQLFSLLWTAIVTLTTIALGTSKAGLFFVAASVVLLFIWLDGIIRRNEAVVYYRGLQLEDQYAPDAENAFIHLYYAATTSEHSRIKKIQAIATHHDLEERIKLLRQYRYSTTGVLLPLLVILMEVSLGVVVWQLFGWKLF